MYEAFFNLQRRPFLPAPHAGRYFPAQLIENSRQTLSRAIERGEGAGLIVGPSGTGKTLLCHLLAAEFASHFDVALLASGRLTTRIALLQAISYELGLPYRGLDEGELRLALLDHLEPSAGGNQGLLLLIDEAHTLPFRLLEEVRMITNLVRDGQSRVRVVLAGSSVLEERFASPKLHSFSQRLAARCYLESLNSAETADYVRSEISRAGGDAAALIDESALRSVYRATDGIPRLINQVCDHALILASLGGVTRLSSDAIDEAWADLQQLPTPASAKRPAAASADSVVEFGGLDEATDDLPEAIPFQATRQPAALQLSHAADRDETIESQLTNIEGGLQLAGSIGTEIDLDFPEFGDPLNEDFAEEEVVMDRFGTEVEIFAEVPRVSSWEGRQLGSMLPPTYAPKPRAISAERPRVTYGELSSDDIEAFDREVTAEPFVAAPVPFFPAADPVLPEDEIESIAAPVNLRELSAAIAASDDSILIVEDGGPVMVPNAVRPKKPEYRQLFAKLRRG